MEDQVVSSEVKNVSSEAKEDLQHSKVNKESRKNQSLTKEDRLKLQEKKKQEKQMRRALAIQKKSETNAGDAQNPMLSTVSRTADSQHSMEMTDYFPANYFAHLLQEQSTDRSTEVHPKLKEFVSNTDKLGSLHTTNEVKSLLDSLKKTIMRPDYLEGMAPASRFPYYLASQFIYVSECFPHCILLSHAMKYLAKNALSFEHSPDSSSAIEFLSGVIDQCIQKHLVEAECQIVHSLEDTIAENDVVLTFGGSELISQCLIAASKKGLKFSVVVVEAEPRIDGAKLVRSLCNTGIEICYVWLSAIECALRNVSKVILEASAVSANGNVLSASGSSLVVAGARLRDIPVYFCSLSWKISPLIILEAFDWNEPDVAGNKKENDGEGEAQLDGGYYFGVNLDLIPGPLIDLFVTEKGGVPGNELATFCYDKC